MRCLFVTPSDCSSGEAITALHIARRLLAVGESIHVLASPFTAQFLERPLDGCVTRAALDVQCNRRLWERTLVEFDPDLVVFAEYPLLFFPGNGMPLADDAWVQSLDGVDAALATLDHLGYAQRAALLFFGPPHIRLSVASVPDPPARMALLLPCPLHEPMTVPGRRGHPFRAFEPPNGNVADARRAVRRRYGGDRSTLIVHSVPTWAWQTAELCGLPYYVLLPRVLEHYLADLATDVTIVSVNNGRLLGPPTGTRVRVRNLESVPVDEYEALLLGADLVLTDNGVSMSLGKAVCGLVACVHMHNPHRLPGLLLARSQLPADAPLHRLLLDMERARPGAVFPFEVFPMWQRDDVEALGLFAGNTFTNAVARVELFGGEPTREKLHALLFDRGTRDALRSGQEAYVDRLRGLADAGTAVRGVLARA